MTTIEFGDSPSLKSNASYTKYREWLEAIFYFKTCAYCLLQHLHLHVDHYEPQKYAPSRINDPTNLLPACSGCNGPGGKSDYHPNHAKRNRLKNHKSGHALIDVRNDDLSKFYEADDNGALKIVKGPNSARAEWNYTLLDLGRSAYGEARGEYMETLRTAEQTSQALQRRLSRADTAGLNASLKVSVDYLAKRYRFFEALEVVISPALRGLIVAVRTELTLPP